MRGCRLLNLFVAKGSGGGTRSINDGWIDHFPCLLFVSVVVSAFYVFSVWSLDSQLDLVKLDLMQEG